MSNSTRQYLQLRKKLGGIRVKRIIRFAGTNAGMNDVSELDTCIQDDNPCSWEVETEICGGVVDTFIECGRIDGDKFSQGDSVTDRFSFSYLICD